MFATAFFLASNTNVCSSPHSKFFTGNFIFFNFFFWFSSLRSVLNYSVKLAALGINFARGFILPGKEPNFLSNFGKFSFCIASVLVRRCRNQFTWFLKNSHFDILNSKFSSSNFFGNFSTNFSCSTWHAC